MFHVRPEPCRGLLSAESHDWLREFQGQVSAPDTSPPLLPETDCKMHYHAEGGAICTYLKSMQPLLLSSSASLNRNGNSLWDQYLSVIIVILVICTSEQWYTYSDSESEQWYVYATQWI